ncbi:uncharacterized protein B0H64DRAFT_144441 [Chaetomium fimeti]|uniref:Secreted protein n=1 Tax=Chaetomium fimeti TaxID=1854472 RepID=A0AAE0HF52_9PEZI|nr:hypothetical protein B0H64DRAFT_144441 [Chaetomium fimeti]
MGYRVVFRKMGACWFLFFFFSFSFLTLGACQTTNVKRDGRRRPHTGQPGFVNEASRAVGQARARQRPQMVKRSLVFYGVSYSQRDRAVTSFRASLSSYQLEPQAPLRRNHHLRHPLLSSPSSLSSFLLLDLLGKRQSSAPNY